MRAISSTSFFIASTSGSSPSSASSSLKRVRMVRRSCDDAGQHGGALLDRALDARLHLDEGLRRAPHLARAARPEVRHLAALAEALGGVGEPQDRLDLVAQEQDRDGRAAPARCRPSRAGRFPSSTHRPRCAGRTRASPCRRAGCGSRPASSGRRCRSRTAGRSACASPPTAPGRAARRTASARAAACRRRGRKSTDQAEPLLRDACGSARGRRPADSSRRCRSARRCPAPPPAESRRVTGSSAAP